MLSQREKLKKLNGLSNIRKVQTAIHTTHVGEVECQPNINVLFKVISLFKQTKAYANQKVLGNNKANRRMPVHATTNKILNKCTDYSVRSFAKH